MGCGWVLVIANVGDFLQRWRSVVFGGILLVTAGRLSAGDGRKAALRPIPAHACQIGPSYLSEPAFSVVMQDGSEQHKCSDVAESNGFFWVVTAGVHERSSNREGEHERSSHRLDQRKARTS